MAYVHATRRSPPEGRAQRGSGGACAARAGATVRFRQPANGGTFMTTNITEEHRRAFETLTSGDYGNFALFPIFVDGAPGAAIVAVNKSPPVREARRF